MGKEEADQQLGKELRDSKLQLRILQLYYSEWQTEDVGN